MPGCRRRRVVARLPNIILGDDEANSIPRLGCTRPPKGADGWRFGMPSLRLALISVAMLMTGCAQPAAPESETLLRHLVDSGTLSDLRWPNFSSYKTDVAKLYGSTAYK